ncbi:hypothetical protein MNEG_12480, partial [Monoraphidium neglectum]
NGVGSFVAGDAHVGGHFEEYYRWRLRGPSRDGISDCCEECEVPMTVQILRPV